MLAQKTVAGGAMVAAALPLPPHIIPSPQDFRKLMPDQHSAAMANYFMRLPAYAITLKINSQRNEKQKEIRHYYAFPIRGRGDGATACFVL